MFVAVSNHQVAILARLSRGMSQTVSSDGPSSHEFASQFGLAIFLSRKTPKNYHENRMTRKCMLNEPASDPSNRGGNTGHGRSIASDEPERQQFERRQLRS